MAMRDGLIVFLAVWVVLSPILSPSTQVFLTLALIGSLIVLEIGEFYLPEETKESLKLSAYFLLMVFAFIVARKVYEVIK